VLHRACLILGGVAQLATHLGVADSAVRVWLEGRQEPPEDVFLAAVEILLLDAEAKLRRPT
jgi:DNA-binding transcriptional regulator YdaS (Cro superfamily)